MARKARDDFKRHVIQADQSQQQPNHSYAPVTEYETKRVPCVDCGRSIVWTAEQQRTWHEEIKASIYATVNLRCDPCRKRGRHDRHRQVQRSKGRRKRGERAR